MRLDFAKFKDNNEMMEPDFLAINLKIIDVFYDCNKTYNN